MLKNVAAMAAKSRTQYLLSATIAAGYHAVLLFSWLAYIIEGLNGGTSITLNRINVWAL